MSTYCPDHTLSRWRVEDAFDSGNTLAIITEWDGMGVWGLGLVPEDDGFRTMRDLAQALCDIHNSQLERSGKAIRGEGDSVGSGFAADLTGREWDIAWVRSEGGPKHPGVRSAGGDAACLLGSAEGLPSNSDITAAAGRMADLHNALLNASRRP